MRIGKSKEFVYVYIDEDTIYSVTRIDTHSKNVFYNIHRFNRDRLEWNFIKQIEVPYIEHKKWRNKFIDIIGWNMLYGVDIPKYISLEQIKKMTNLFLDKILSGKIEDNRWRAGKWPQSKKMAQPI